MELKERGLDIALPVKSVHFQVFDVVEGADPGTVGRDLLRNQKTACVMGR